MYEGKNYVPTNQSSSTHGQPASLSVTRRAATVVLSHGLKGGNRNRYAIEIDRGGTLPELVAELIEYCPRSAVPQLMGALGKVLVADS